MSTFPLIPDYVIEEELEFKTRIIDFESGKEQRQAQWASGKKRFVLKFKNRDKTDYETLKTFFSDMLGQYGSFDFTNPLDGLTYTCRFESDVFRGVKDTPAQIMSFECTLVEVW